MNILAVETSTAALSLTLQVGEAVFQRHEVVPREHAKLILPWIDELISEAGIQLSQLDAIAVGCGPGGFTGIRIGMCVVQGIALVHDTPVVPVSSLRALAQCVMDDASASHVLIAQDAKMGQVYWAAYQSDSQGIAQVNIEDQLCHPDIVPLPEDQDWLMVGDAWDVYPALERHQHKYRKSKQQYPHAEAILKLGKYLFKQGEQASAELALPVYLRDKSAWKKPPFCVKKPT